MFPIYGLLVSAFWNFKMNFTKISNVFDIQLSPNELTSGIILACGIETRTTTRFSFVVILTEVSCYTSIVKDFGCDLSSVGIWYDRNGLILEIRCTRYVALTYWWCRIMQVLIASKLTYKSGRKDRFSHLFLFIIVTTLQSMWWVLLQFVKSRIRINSWHFKINCGEIGIL